MWLVVRRCKRERRGRSDSEADNEIAVRVAPSQTPMTPIFDSDRQAGERLTTGLPPIHTDISVLS